MKLRNMRFCSICGWQWHVVAIMVVHLPKRKMYICSACQEAVVRAKYWSEEDDAKA